MHRLACACVVSFLWAIPSCQPRERGDEHLGVGATPLELASEHGRASDQVAPLRSPDRKPDVIFVPTPEPVVREMLTMANVGAGDVVYDLGCGDGRIPIAAVRDFGAARAVCVDIDPVRVRDAREHVRRAGLADRIEVRQADLFETDLREADVVTLYLLQSLNLKLRPKLQRELRPGSRVVSQSFSMGDWEPERQAEVDGKRVYRWTIGK
jgi:SAM-dependent methyltransferase